MAVTLTTDERDLLREWPRFVETCLASPVGAQRIRDSRSSGGGFGRNYHIDRGKLIGTWCRYEVVARFTDGPHKGQPARLRFDPPHREVSITLTRLQKWADQLPATYRDQAAAFHQPDTRDLDALRHLALEALDHDQPAQLDLFQEVS
ncbi:hypothetical protein HOV42_gp69 [Gordonia phage Fairfaxidum]|uniref:Uncharacterized protein n=1 Tax=Gordonia phage Fairfaxidum TaxID=2572526 RepID=A0A4D6TE77_9CAUD|nr:hypothetical protein HOV42_gp69 [Gordonia phage Fairfaxidum]QCG77652.1 hypothetical protein SEA_FAIRFAXIDUM_69 [Gordonia phage Fairfaxidum]